MLNRKHIELGVRSLHTNDGTVVTPESYYEAASEKGIKALAITDLNSVRSFPATRWAAKKRNVKPVFGARVFCSRRYHGNGRVGECEEWFELTLLVKNQTGLRHLYEIITKLNHSDLKNHDTYIDYAEVYRHREGLLMGMTLLDACEQPIPEGVKEGETRKVDPSISFLKADIRDMADYIEVRPLIPWTETPEFIKTANRLLRELSSIGIPAVAVTNANCIREEDEERFREANGLTPSDYARVRYLPDTYDYERLFDWLDEDLERAVVFDNPERILEKIEEIRFPDHDSGIKLSLSGAKEELRKRCFKAAEKKCGSPLLKEIEKRIENELKMISNSGSESWFVIASELVNVLESNGFPHGFRGSVGNTLTGYLLGISNADPVKYDLQPEIFFGLNGEKEADIDLSIPEEARSTVVRRLMTMFDGRVFRGFNHPGEYIVMPFGEDILDHSPLMKNDREEPVHEMTCFSGHEMDCPKIDILSHQLLSELNELRTVTGVKPNDDELEQVPLYDEYFFGVLCLAGKISAVSFSDFVILSGLAHGTNTWTDNAEDLLRNGICSLEDVIAFRDDVYRKLRDHGYEKTEAYRLMELIRKGLGYKLSEDEIDTMRRAGIEEWYIESMKKIKYLFPKAHAIDYAIQAARANWYRVHFPEEYAKVHGKECEDRTVR